MNNAVIKQYINNAVEAIQFLKPVGSENKIEKLNKDALTLGTGVLKSKEDLAAIEKVISMSDNILLFLNNDDELEQQLYKSHSNKIKIISIDTPAYLLGVDIYFPISQKYNSFLVENKKLFIGSIYASGVSYRQDCETMIACKEYFGAHLDGVNSAFDICKRQFGEVLSEDKLGLLVNSDAVGIDKTMLFFRLALENRSFIDRCCELSYFYNNLAKSDKSDLKVVNYTYSFMDAISLRG